MSNPISYDTADMLTLTQLVVACSGESIDKASLDSYVEKELCLNLARTYNDLSGTSTASLSGVVYPPNEIQYGHQLIVNNMIIDTPNFIYKAEFMTNAIDTSGESFTLLIGDNTFDSSANSITKPVEINPASAAIVEGSVEIDISMNIGQFSSTTEGIWSAEFANVSGATLALAINTQHNNTREGVSLLSVQEDVSFNSNYAIANLQSQFDKYFTAAGNGQLSANQIPISNTLSGNLTHVYISGTSFDNSAANNFGAYKIFVNPPQIDVTIEDTTSVAVSNTELPFVDQSNGLVYDSLDLSGFVDKFGEANTVEGWNFDVTVTSLDPSGGGYFPVPPVQAPDAFSIDNTTIVGNFAYMAANYQNLGNYMVITQSGMDIVLSDVSSNAANISLFALTLSGETLDASAAGINGNIELYTYPQNERVTSVSGDNVYTQTVVYYSYEHSGNYISGNVLSNFDVSYSLVNTVLPTGHDQYNSNVDSNGTSLYVGLSGITIDLSSNISSVYGNDWANYITIAVSKNLAQQGTMFSLSGNLINANVNATTNNSSTTLLTYDDYRILLNSKTVNDLGYTISSGTPDLSGVWTQGTLSGTPAYLISSVAAAETGIIPNKPQIIALFDISGSFIDVSGVYGTVGTLSGQFSPSYLFDTVNVVWGISGQNSANITANNIYYTNEDDVSKTITVVFTDSNYKVVQTVTVTTYNATFQFPLAFFDNYAITTPELKSTVTYYTIYSANTNLVINTSGPINTITSDAPALPIRTLATYGNTYLPTEVTVVNSDSSTPYFNMQLTADSISELSSALQGKNNADVSWNTLSTFVNQEPFSTLTSVISSTSPDVLNLTVDITPGNTNSNISSQMSLNYESYYIPLERNSDVIDYFVSGLSYPTADSTLNFTASFSPDVSDNGFTADAPTGYTGFVVDVSASYDLSFNITLVLSDNASSSRLATIKGLNAGFVSNMSLFTVPLPIFQISGTGGNVSGLYQVQGDDSIASGTLSGVSSGLLQEDTGIATTYIGISGPFPGTHYQFAVKPDQIGVNLVGSVSGTSDIVTLEYQTVSGPNHSEILSINQYRGFDFIPVDGVLGDSLPWLSGTQNYTIARNGAQASATYFVSGATGSTECIFGDLFYQYTAPLTFGDVGVVGADVTFNWSRLPQSYLTGTVLQVPVGVSGDLVHITDTNGLNLNQNLAQGISGTFLQWVYLDGTELVSDRVRLNAVNVGDVTVSGVEYDTVYHKSTINIDYSPSYVGDPSGFSYTNIINQEPFANIEAGVLFDSSGMTLSGPFEIQMVPEVPVSSTSYLVVAPPYLDFTQGGANAVKTVPFDVSDNTQFDESQVFSEFEPVTSESVGTTYNPFSSVSTTNDVTFQQNYSKNYSDYVTSDIPTQNFDITGSYVTLNEYHGTNHQVFVRELYSGLITEMNTSPNLSVSVSGEIYTVAFNQSTFFEHSGNNIVFDIGNNTLPPSDTFLVLNAGEGVTGTLYGVTPLSLSGGNYALQLYKYDTNQVNFSATDVSGDFTITSLPFIPLDKFTSVITVSGNSGMLTSTPYNLTTSLLGLDETNMTLSGGGIVWTQDLSFNTVPYFPFNFVALSISGRQLLGETLGANATFPIFYNYYTTPNIMEVKSGDGAPTFVLTANGLLKTVQTTTQQINYVSSTLATSDSNKTEYVAYNVLAMP